MYTAIPNASDGEKDPPFIHRSALADHKIRMSLEHSLARPLA